MLGGCVLVPELSYKPEFHNPFPQLRNVAILPFFNQSEYSMLNGIDVAKAYGTEMQKIPGYEVTPIGVVAAYIADNDIQVSGESDLQDLAQRMGNDLGVDAIVIGAVTTFEPSYPPQLGLSINWYAANPSFHRIPAGYGLPWGTSEEEYIPNEIVHEAEFELAREQMKTQTPPLKQTAIPADEELLDGEETDDGTGLPSKWPDPRGFIPPAPRPEAGQYNPQSRPIIELTRHYDGANADLTSQLENYFYFRDDARFGGWRSYLDRSSDFIQFCCYLHITEMLSARGGASESRLVFRWPISRYDR